MRNPFLSEGDLVYVRNHGLKGQNKTQDWDPTPYRMALCPPERCVVCSITPTVQGGPVQQVHQTELRGVPAGGLRTGTGQHSREEQVDTGDNGETDSNPPEMLASEFYSEESISESELCPEVEGAVEEEEEDIETEESPVVVEGL